MKRVGTERRRFQRVMTPVYYRIPKYPSPKRRVSDLSVGGVRIFCDESLGVGQTLELEFALPDGSVLEASAEVVWIRKLEPGAAGLYDVGMEFTDLSDEVRKALVAVLKTTSPPDPA